LSSVASNLTGRAAVFGGTFDPVHNTHLAIARAAREAFGLAKVIFVPAANPPHKHAGASAGYEDRLRMLELACAGDAHLEVSRIEADASKRSYSILTIERLLADGAGTPLAFLIGADAFAEIRTWHRWRDVVAKVQFIVVTRPGAAYTIPEGAMVHELPGFASPISSSAVRAEIGSGAVAGGVPPAVLHYIRERGLYS
jgi:nicotinate-nucleotide adenylyltransferase